jgi:hypothetical protein
MNHGISHGKSRHEPLIVIPAVGFVDYAHGIGLNDTEILISGTSGNHMGFVPFRKLHGYPKRDQSELPLFQTDFTGGPQVDPVRYSIDIGESVNLIRKVFDGDLQGVSVR